MVLISQHCGHKKVETATKGHARPEGYNIEQRNFSKTVRSETNNPFLYKIIL